MPDPAAPSTQWEAKATDAPLLTPLYLMQSSSVFALDDAGPAQASFVYNGGLNRVYVDDNPDAVGSLRISISDSGILSLY